MVVLWLLILRGISIELRMHIDLRVWREFLDGCFVLASLLLAVFFGAALANVIRGVPLGADEYFFLPFWTNWNVGPHPGILDWYTAIVGLVAVAAVAVRGALYVAVKTEGPLQLKSCRLGQEGLVRSPVPHGRQPDSHGCGSANNAEQLYALSRCAADSSNCCGRRHRLFRLCVSEVPR